MAFPNCYQIEWCRDFTLIGTVKVINYREPQKNIQEIPLYLPPNTILDEKLIQDTDPLGILHSRTSMTLSAHQINIEKKSTSPRTEGQAL